MEGPSSPERVDAGWSDDERGSARDGIGMDGEREYQRLRKGASRCQPPRACTFFFRGPFLCLSLTMAWLL